MKHEFNSLAERYVDVLERLQSNLLEIRTQTFPSCITSESPGWFRASFGGVIRDDFQEGRHRNPAGISSIHIADTEARERVPRLPELRAAVTVWKHRGLRGVLTGDESWTRLRNDGVRSARSGRKMRALA